MHNLHVSKNRNITETKIDVTKPNEAAKTVDQEESKVEADKAEKSDVEKASTGKFGEREGSEL